MPQGYSRKNGKKKGEKSREREKERRRAEKEKQMRSPDRFCEKARQDPGEPVEPVQPEKSELPEYPGAIPRVVRDKRCRKKSGRLKKPKKNERKS
jgi:hypothetical protein